MGVQGEVNLFYNFTKNTQRISQLESAVGLQERWKDNVLLVFSDVNLVFSKNEDFVFKGFGHLRYNRLINNWLAWEAFSQGQFDRVLLIQLRWLKGTGPRFKLYKKKKSKAYVGVMGMYEYEQEQTGTVRRDFRGSSYLSFQVQPNEVLKVSHISYYQPLFNDFKDYRVTTSTSLEFKVTKVLTFKTAFSLNYDSNPVDAPDIVNLTYAVSNGLSLKF